MINNQVVWKAFSSDKMCCGYAELMMMMMMCSCIVAVFFATPCMIGPGFCLALLKLGAWDTHACMIAVDGSIVTDFKQSLTCRVFLSFIIYRTATDKMCVCNLQKFSNRRGRGGGKTRV